MSFSAFAKPAGSSIFGQGTTQPQTSIFGNTTQQAQPQQQQQQQQQQGNSLFGGSLLGQQPQQNQQPSSSNPLFGSTTGQQQQQTTQPSSFGGFNFDRTALTTQSMGTPLFVKSTKFNDLPDQVKRTLESIDTHISGRVQISNDLKQRKLGEEATKGQELLRSVHKELVSVITVLQNDVHHTRDLKTKTDQTVQDTIVATRIIDGFRNPQQSGQYLKTYASFPLEFFERVTEEMRTRLRWYKLTIEQIERKLASIASQSQPTPHAISSTLQAQHAIFVSLASKTAVLDAELQKIKTLYTQLWRAKTGSRRDPFNELDRGTGADFGMDGLNGK
ncbi:hypothetical protein BC835DRAFT_1340107 [Cytidiella melzeri]|nr:hypothetical protein BC835DRAFT_1340107 [Cytidiella melzeri]